jgi:hypothetical protein
MIYGTFLSFHSKENFLEAFFTLKNSGAQIETFTPYAVEETFTPEPKYNPVKVAGLVGAITGALTGFFMQWISNVLYSPENIGGRPLNSWPAFFPVTWVMTILFTGMSVFIALWTKLKLPMPYHPVFNAKAFALKPNHFGILILSQNPTDLNKIKADSIEEVLC